MSPSNSNLKTLVSLSKLFFSFSLLLHTAIADDGVFMSKLAKSLTPTPSGWTTATTFCTWTGVKCDDSNRVMSINVASKSHTGTIPSGLNSLSQLTIISFQSNSLTGALPSLANLSNLQVVYLRSNNFTSIPDGCFQGLTSLQKLSMTGNTNLKAWTFPSELTQSLSLVKLDLSQTNLIGSLPNIFSSLSSLQDLRLSHNNLTGDLPNSFSGSGIQNLWLNNQQDGFGFTGSLNLLSSMSHLTQVWFQKNKFTGPIPDLSKCTNLFELQLHDNQLAGVVPGSLMSLSSLMNVSLDNNHLQGPFPSFGKGVEVAPNNGINSFCKDTPGPCDPRVTTLLDVAAGFGYPLQLASSWVKNDPCQGWSFVLSSRGKIITVNLAKLKLNGTISPAFGNLTDLRNLYLGDNNLSGSIPGSLTGLTQLEVLDVSNNNLSGEIPKFSTKVKFNSTGNVLLGPSGGDKGKGTTPPESSGGTPSGSPSGKSGGSSLSPALIAGIVVIAVFFCCSGVVCVL